MKAVVIPVTAFEQNCSILICEDTLQAAVVDPGGNLDEILEKIDELRVKVVLILITHGHLDHCGSASELKSILDVNIEGPHRDDDFWILQLSEQGNKFGMPNAKTFEPDRWLEHGDRVKFGNVHLDVLHCPGHTPGHVVFYNSLEKVAIVGDVLFSGSIGRTDFPRGDHSELINSITKVLWPLGSEIKFLPL